MLVFINVCFSIVLNALNILFVISTDLKD